MSLMLKQQRNGALRPCWYGVYELDGKRKVVNLNVKVKGNPAESLRVGDLGDKDFERSREKAEEALAKFIEESRHKGRTDHLVERLIEAKAGTVPVYLSIDGMMDKWLAGGKYSKGYIAQCKAIFARFSEHMRERNPKAVYVYQIRPADATSFAAAIGEAMSPATFNAYIGILRPACDLCLPVGSPNPFRMAKRGKRITQGARGDASIHRQPFTPDELQRILNVANGDDFMAGLIVAAACTGMRRGDVCRLHWRDVDLAGGMVTAKASKTGEPVEVPIFAPLRAVLDARHGNGSEYVFPEAARMLEANPDGLTYRFKSIIARALDTNPQEPGEELVPASSLATEAAAAIRNRFPEGPRRERMLDTFRRYADGESIRDVEKATGRARATISADLACIENWTGQRFIRSVGPGGVKKAIARVTRVHREQGQKSASIRDWHALRTTFVTLTLSAGVPMELVRRVTGHTTVDIVLRHYFRPGRESFREAFTKALPGVMTGREAELEAGSVQLAISEKAVGGNRKSEAKEDELVRLAGIVAAGTATEKDRKRLRVLAAAV